jgi:hypothetical protein
LTCRMGNVEVLPDPNDQSVLHLNPHAVFVLVWLTAGKRCGCPHREARGTHVVVTQQVVHRCIDVGISWPKVTRIAARIASRPTVGLPSTPTVGVIHHCASGASNSVMRSASPNAATSAVSNSRVDDSVRPTLPRTASEI